MRAWLDNLAGPQYATAVIWTLGALIVLAVVLVLVRIIRNLTSGTFVVGGRNRKMRLAVMDATAIDSQRRLVLVRRDDVEHLLLIGGPTDVVVEQGISYAGPAPRNAHEPEAEAPRIPQPRTVPRPAAASAPVAESPRPAAPPAPRLVPQPAHAPQPAHNLAEARQPVRPIAPLPRAASETLPPVTRPPLPPEVGAPSARPAEAPPPPVRVEPRPSPEPARAAPTVEPAPRPAAAAAQERRAPDLDSALQRELKASLDDPQAAPADRPDPTLEDEMARLLGELSSRARK